MRNWHNKCNSLRHLTSRLFIGSNVSVDSSSLIREIQSRPHFAQRTSGPLLFVSAELHSEAVRVGDAGFLCELQAAPLDLG